MSEEGIVAYSRGLIADRHPPSTPGAPVSCRVGLVRIEIHVKVRLTVNAAIQRRPPCARVRGCGRHGREASHCTLQLGCGTAVIGRAGCDGLVRGSRWRMHHLTGARSLLTPVHATAFEANFSHHETLQVHPADHQRARVVFRGRLQYIHHQQRKPPYAGETFNVYASSFSEPGRSRALPDGRGRIAESATLELAPRESSSRSSRRNPRSLQDVQHADGGSTSRQGRTLPAPRRLRSLHQCVPNPTRTRSSRSHLLWVRDAGSDTRKGVPVSLPPGGAFASTIVNERMPRVRRVACTGVKRLQLSS